MRIEKEIVATENGYTKDGIDYYHLKTYYIYSDKGTYVGAASIECTAKGFEPGTSVTFQSRYNSLVEKAKRLDKEESQKQEEQNKPEEEKEDPNKDVPIEETTIDPGKNWQEGKKTSSFSGNDKYSKPTYKVEIKYKSDGNIYLSKGDFADKTEAKNWLDEQKEKTNESLSSATEFSNSANGLESKPSDKKYNDVFTDEIIKCEPLTSSSSNLSSTNSLGNTINNISSEVTSNLQNSASSNGDELKDAITKAFGTAKNPLSFSYNDIVNNISKITTDMSTKISLRVDQKLNDAKNMLNQKVAEITAKSFEDAKTTMAKEIDKLNINSEKLEEITNKEINEGMEKAGNLAMEQKNKIDKLCAAQIMAKALQGAAEIARHMDEGPAYVIKEVYKLLKPLQSQMESITTRTNGELDKQQDKLAQSLGVKKGLAKAEEFNKKIQKLAKEQYEKLKTAESKAKNKAFQALQVAKLKIMALTGVKV